CCSGSNRDPAMVTWSIFSFMRDELLGPTRVGTRLDGIGGRRRAILVGTDRLDGLTGCQQRRLPEPRLRGGTSPKGR
ncbi:MAG: hypothetical protein ACE5LB_10490, partial [Acidiferrobacterales bacterium]